MTLILLEILLAQYVLVDIIFKQTHHYVQHVKESVAKYVLELMVLAVYHVMLYIIKTVLYVQNVVQLYPVAVNAQIRQLVYFVILDIIFRQQINANYVKIFLKVVVNVTM